MATKRERPTRAPGAKDRPGVSRRAALVGGLVATGIAVEELRRVWWRLPHVDKPRKPGAVDFAGATWTGASPVNWRRADRPDDFPVDRVVVHVAQGDYRSAVSAFRDPRHHAAAHYLVRGDGHVLQMVRELDVAFHAGNRAYNERSVGVEHEGFVTDAHFPAAMYQASARLTAAICRRYDIPVDRTHVVGHSEVPGADHTDPGPHWDWDRYMGLVRRAHRAR